MKVTLVQSYMFPNVFSVEDAEGNVLHVNRDLVFPDGSNAENQVREWVASEGHHIVEVVRQEGFGYREVEGEKVTVMPRHH